MVYRPEKHVTHCSALLSSTSHLAVWTVHLALEREVAAAMPVNMHARQAIDLALLREFFASVQLLGGQVTLAFAML